MVEVGVDRARGLWCCGMGVELQQPQPHGNKLDFGRFRAPYPMARVPSRLAYIGHTKTPPASRPMALHKSTLLSEADAHPLAPAHRATNQTEASNEHRPSCGFWNRGGGGLEREVARVGSRSGNCADYGQ